MCHHFRITGDARIAQARDASVETSRARTEGRTTDDRDAPADTADYVDIEAVAERVDGEDASDPEGRGRVEADPEPVGFA